MLSGNGSRFNVQSSRVQSSQACPSPLRPLTQRVLLAFKLVSLFAHFKSPQSTSFSSSPSPHCMADGFVDASYMPSIIDGSMSSFWHIVRASDNDGSVFPCIISLIRGALMPNSLAKLR